MIITKIVYPLLKSAIISWNLLGYFCESWDMTLRICFLMQGLHGAGHLPANTSGARILICLPMSSQGPLLDAQSIWNLIKSSSLSLSSVMRFVAAQETPLATFWTPLTTVSRIPPCCFAGAGLLCCGSGRGGGGAPLTPKRAFAGAPPRYAPWGWGGGTAPRYGGGGGGPFSLLSWTGYCCWSTVDWCFLVFDTFVLGPVVVPQVLFDLEPLHYYCCCFHWWLPARRQDYHFEAWRWCWCWHILRSVQLWHTWINLSFLTCLNTLM